MDAEPRREHAVARGRHAATLDVPEDGDTRLEPRQLLEPRGDDRGDAAEPLEPERIPRCDDAGAEWGRDPFRHDDHGVPMASVRAAPHDRRDLVEIVRRLRHEDRVGAGGHPGVGRDPSLRPAHHLDDHHAVVGLGRRGDAIDRLGRDLDGGVEPDRRVGARDVVVDRLRDTDDGNPLLDESRGRPQRPVPADDDERVEPFAGDGPGDRRATLAVNVRVPARRAEDRPAALQEAAHGIAVEREDAALHQPVPPVEDPHDLRAVLPMRPGHEATDRRVQAGAVATARENPDAAHGPILG